MEPQEEPTREEAATPSRPRPPGGFFEGAPVTRAIFWANIVVFVGELLVAIRRGAFFDIPFEVSAMFGAHMIDFPIFVVRPERWVTSAFLHGSVLHLAFNMAALRNLSPNLERSVSSGRFALMYVGAAMTGSFGSFVEAWFRGPRISVGASGAICGVIAAATVVHGRLLGWHNQRTQALAGWLIVIFLIGANTAMTDNGAHVGGAFGGLVIALLWRRNVTYSDRARRLCITAAAVVCVGSAAVVALHDARDPCLLQSNEACLQHAITSLSARQCDEARAAARSAVFFGDTRFDSVRRSIAHQCAD